MSNTPRQRPILHPLIAGLIASFIPAVIILYLQNAQILPIPTNQITTPTHAPLLPSMEPPSPKVRVEDLGLSPSVMPDPPGPNQVIVAHGDIDDTGTCHVKVFATGAIIQGLGNGTYRLVRVTGTPEQIEEQVARIQRDAEDDPAAHGSCPMLP